MTAYSIIQKIFNNCQSLLDRETVKEIQEYLKKGDSVKYEEVKLERMAWEHTANLHSEEIVELRRRLRDMTERLYDLRETWTEDAWEYQRVTEIARIGEEVNG